MGKTGEQFLDTGLNIWMNGRGMKNLIEFKLAREDKVGLISCSDLY